MAVAAQPVAGAVALMSLQSVRAHYASARGPAVHAVDGVSLELAKGEVLGIVGESGCGKSTLATAVGLLARPPLQVTGGQMILDGQAIRLTDQARLPRALRGRLIAALPQGAMNALNPTARIQDLAFDVIRAHEPTVRRNEAVERARIRLEQLALPARVLDSYPHQLSGGMRQRVVAALSTLLNPRVLVADEPTSALDVSSQKALIVLLRQLLDGGFIEGILFITHDLPLLSAIADRIAVMYAGKIVETGTTSEVIDCPRHPYTAALVDSVLVPEPDIRQRRIEGIGGAPPDLRNPPAGCRFHPRCPLAMEVCCRYEPPEVGTDQRFAACWWVLEQDRHQPVRS